MRCRDANNKPTMQIMKDPQVQSKPGKGGAMKFSAKGICSNCGGNQFKFLSAADAEALKKAA